MPSAVWLRGGASWFWVDPADGVLATRPIAPTPAQAAERLAAGSGGLDRSGFERLRRESGQPDATLSEELAEAASGLGLPGRRADPGLLAAARARLPRRSVVEERALLLPLAHAAAVRALASPVETLIALAREEARLERALGRERAAATHWVAVPGTVLAEQADAQRSFGDRFAAYHDALDARLEASARAVVPNLSSLVGPRVAGRLVAAAGGRPPLARMSAARLQLLGARRRPNPESGPRYGLLFRAPGVEELPEPLRARFARSLAALAVIAVRADEHTHRDLSVELERRRARRWNELRRRRR